MIDPDAVAFDDDGLVAGVVQDAATGRVLMLAYLNRQSLEATLESGEAHFWSRSRQELWRKGATSGNTLAVVEVTSDCDGDALLISARPAGPACHTGTVSCFGDEAKRSGQGFAGLERLWATISDRARHRPAGSYTAALLAGGVDAVSRKVLEEAGEVILAAKGDEGEQRVAEEAADLLYHLLVLLAERGVAPRTALGVLATRARGE